MRLFFAAVLAFALPSAALAQSDYPTAVPGDRAKAIVPLQCNAAGASCVLVSAANPAVVGGGSAAPTDAMAGQTAISATAQDMRFNGSTWDRARGMGINTTTGDTGAKVATGNGTTLTNIGNRGVQLLLRMGAVTGTSPTFVLKIQSSTDGGVTWIDVPGAATATLTATGDFGILLYPGLTATAGTTVTGTTTAASMILPRTWRVAWTIGGTTPSFTITEIQYNYLVN